ncbi:hypothetical protein [Clostridium pasteurianum]|uniref:Uncharacterized protein n=1 Tax=Clostridium pasteurianum BC1 TaxID=86416 RepID=R4K8Y5_CLOPA|nr:hypothetical protein [Clostridium pasteurianum]AGK98171.1 hypothetical protein Clopa_3375 [Clostridium pasteurianum BC1]
MSKIDEKAEEKSSDDSVIEETENKPVEKPSSYIIKEDCKVTYKGHFLEYKKGTKLDNLIGKYLLETGAPVKEVK